MINQGVAPIRYQTANGILSPARLPIPSFRRLLDYYTGCGADLQVFFRGRRGLAYSAAKMRRCGAASDARSGAPVFCTRQKGTGGAQKGYGSAKRTPSARRSEAFDLRGEVLGEDGEACRHVFILHQNALAHVQVRRGKIPDRLDPVGNQQVTDLLRVRPIN